MEFDQRSGKDIMKRIFVFVLSVFGFLMGQGAPIQFVPDGVELPPAETTPVASPVPSASVPASVVVPVPESSPASTAAPVSAEPPVSAAAPTPVAPAPGCPGAANFCARFSCYRKCSSVRMV